MKKTAFLMAGVAVLALSATAASAQTVGGFSTGQRTTGFGIPLTNGVVSVTRDVPSLFGGSSAANIARANNANSNESAWHAVGVSVGNVGEAVRFDNATFSLQGRVSTDCAFYTGTSNSLSFDFGQIGIYVSDNTGPAAAFTMVAPAAMNFDTNLAGCNTSNTVTVSKNDIRGLVNNSGAGYDSNVFQANLPYSVTGSYTAGAVGSAAPASQGNYISLATTANSTSASHGAWKSAMSLDVAIPVPSKSLLAGAYEGQLTVAIQAF